MNATLQNALTGSGPALLFGVRLWASVCLALYVAFYLQLGNAFWAGATAATLCQPKLGASLRKMWFRIIGTITGATLVVVLTASFPQDRIAFLGILALWCSVCAFAATLLRNFASYSAALAGYTAVTIATDTLGATGGASAEVFWVAVWRASAVCLGIMCADVVLAGTDLGSAPRRLASLFADLAAEITGRFTGTLAQAGPELPETTPERRELVRRVIALDPVVDQAIGESSELRYHSATLQKAVHGLFTALDGWRGVAAHLKRLPNDISRQEAETVLRSFPREAPSASATNAQARWMADPPGLRGICDATMRTLRALPARTPSLRLLADETAKLGAGISHVVDGLALLVDGPDRDLRADQEFHLCAPDWMPALVNGARAFIAIGAVELFWVVTAWPSAGLAIFFVAALLMLLSPRPNQAFAATMVTVGIGASVLLAAIAKFAVLPALSSFPGFCMALGLFLLPIGFLKAYSRKPSILAMLGTMPLAFMVLLAPANQMSYDTGEYYNSALAVFVGGAAAVLSLRLLPPLSPALRTRRLLAFALRDLRRLAVDSLLPSSEDWDGRMYSRLVAVPNSAEPLQRAQLLAALSVGDAIMQLRRLSPLLDLGPELDASLAALAQGDSAMARAWLARLDDRLASLPDAGPGADLALRARASILVLSEALPEHAAYFDAGAPS